MIKLIQKLTCACMLIAMMCACQKDSLVESVHVTNKGLLKVLQDKGYTVENGKLIVDEKVLNTHSLNLSGVALDSLTGMEVFVNLEELDLTKNPHLTDISGLDSKTSKLKVLRLPYVAHRFTGNVRAFLKEKQTAGHTVDAQVETADGSTTTEPYHYYEVIENRDILNVMFALFSEDAFDMVKDTQGNDVVAFDLSHRHEADHLPKMIDLKINGAAIKSYDILLHFVNSYFHYLGVELSSLEITTTSPAQELAYVGNLDVSKYDKLKKLTLMNLPFTSVIANNCTALEEVNIGRDLLVHKNLKYLLLKQLDFSGCDKLSRLTLHRLPLEKLIISPQARLESLTLDSIRGVTDLPEIHYWGNTLKMLSVSNVPLHAIGILSNIEDLRMDRTKITELDLSLCHKLTGNIQITQNDGLTSLKLPTKAEAECKKLELYGNNLTGELDLSNYKRIRHLKFADEPFPALKAPQKKSETGLTSVKVNAEQLIAHAQPWEGMKSYDNLMQIDADLAILVKSSTLKSLFDKRGEKRIKIYQYAHKGLWWNNMGALSSYPELEK